MKIYFTDFDLDINAIENRPGNFPKILLYFFRRTNALPCFVAKISTGTWIHCRHQHKGCWILYGALSAGDCNNIVFQWLTEYFQNIIFKFRKLIEKKNSMMGKRYFTW